MALSVGTLLGSYEIIAPIGAGGMGEVYRARDSKLNRNVAIKVLPAALSKDSDYMARFQREAQVLASLNHPNIAVIYGLEDHAIVMELVEGPTLAERIARGQLPVEEALPIARQIADALEAAHEKGVVHRDLKPGNVKVTSDGVVKVLDFGLAKTADGHTTSDASISPTLTICATEAGMILGTAAYMSPEQTAGKPVDKRADIWSFGVLLWELLTGRRLFDGETVSHTLADVLRAEIDFNQLPAKTPAIVRDLLRRCLDRDVKTRLRDIGEARIALQKSLANPTAEAVTSASATEHRLPWIALALTGVAILALIVTTILLYRATRPTPLRALMRLNVEIAPDTPLAGPGGRIALSPDGNRLALCLRGTDGVVRLHTRLLHQNQVVPLAGTEGARDPFFSPDGGWIGFFTDGKLKKISMEGGAPIPLCDAGPSPRGASWGDDGNIIAALNFTGTLSRIPANGGTPVPVTKLNSGERSHRWPQVLPGSQAVLFTVTNQPGVVDATVEVLSLKTSERKTVRRGGFFARYVPTSPAAGYLVYMHQGTLFDLPFDPSHWAVTGEPATILEDVSGGERAGGDFAFSGPSSGSGTFVYLAGKEQPTRWSISWLDRSGKTQLLYAPGAPLGAPRLSPDGKRLAFGVAGRTSLDIWMMDLDRDTPSRLSLLPGENRWPVWTPDGKNIVFQSTNQSAPGLYWISSDGSGQAQRLTDGSLNEQPYSFSPDGRLLAFDQNGIDGSRDIFTAQVEGDFARGALAVRLVKPQLFLGTPAIEALPAFSPDGRWLAYASNESGTMEVYVRAFPGPGGRWPISTGGGRFPVWSRDGRELIFETFDLRVMTVSYTAKADSFVPGKPRAWSETRLADNAFNSNYDVAPDGKRLLAVFDQANDKPPTHLTFLLNFFDELRRRASER